jgi:hypothetical protein
MGLKQLIVLTQGPTSSASSQHASCLPTEQSATVPGTGSARWELRDNLWGLDPSPAHMDICLVTVFNGARPCGGPFCTLATPTARRSQRRDSEKGGPPCPRRLSARSKQLGV